MGKYTKPSIIDGGQSFTYPPHMNYGFFVLEMLLKNKVKAALIDGETAHKITYGEMAQQIVNIASSLKRNGVGENDVIGICSENRTEFLVTAIAGMSTGAAVTFINCSYSKNEVTHTMNISKPNYMFLSTNTYNNYFETMNSLNVVKEFYVFDDSQPSLKSFKDLVASHVDIDSFPPIKINGTERTALILYSSGTTGLPKGAKLSHCNIITSGLRPSVFARDIICLSVAPWSNTVGIILTMLALLYNETIVYLRKYQEEKYLKNIEKYKVQILLAVPPLVVMLSKSRIIKQYDTSSVEIIYCGGAPLGASVIEESKKMFPNLKFVLNGYGMTEATGVVTEETELEPRQGSVGKAAPGLIIKVVDVETRELLGPNKPGELCFNGPILFKGYVGKDLADDLDNEGFYKTGDIAYYDEDGYFYIVDRMKEIIKYKASQVSPSELEESLLEHPGVKDAAVVGKPDPLAGELPTAFVVKFPEVQVTEKELVDFIAAKVSSWKQLRGGVYFVDEIPKLGSGKILRRQLRALLKHPKSKL